MIVISGGPNTNSEIENQILHHTTGEPSDYKYVKNIFRHVTAKSVIIDQASEAPTLIDQAIVTALRERKPVYIEIACNLSEHRISKPNKFDFDFVEKSDPSSLKAAVEHAAKILNAAEKPILVGGAKIRSYNAIKAFKKLADASSYAVAMMPDAKGFFSEKHPHFIGIYWGSVSSPACGEIVESCDAYLFAGPIFSDYTTTGFSSLINPKKLLLALPRYVKIEGQTYNKVMLEEFLQALSKKIKKNPKSLLAYKRIRGEAPIEKASHSKETLSTRRLFARIQEMLTSRSVVIAETGDSWFNCMKLKLPEGCGFEIQMQYGSIGWSVGAALGNALGHKQPKHVIALIGDGSFQMTAQEVSTMIRYNVPLIIFLINNGSYTIEVQIHDNIYNVIKNWKYAELVDVFNAADGKGWSCQVKNEKELAAAIQKAQKHKGPSLIEVMIHRDDVNKSLLKWGTAVAMNNSRAPKGQSMFTYWV
jgi:TPP-dependent 2-oxoacid decarboxylase